MQSVPTRAGNLVVDIKGEGAPLVLLHAITHDRRDFDPIVPALAKSWKTIAVDWPGHGDSDMWSPPESASTAGLCDALEDLVEELDLPPAIFIGNSVGGTASVRLAARRPERVRALVLVDSGGSATPSALLSAVCWVQGHKVVRAWTGMRFARMYMKTPGPGRDDLFARMTQMRQRPGFIDMEAAMWRSFGTSQNDLSDVAPAVKAPTLIVWGTHDPVVRARVEGKRLRAMLPHAEYVELATGHVPFLEKPDAFLEQVLPFLDSTRSTGGRAAADRRNNAA